jgi:hypothetical protein
MELGSVCPGWRVGAETLAYPKVLVAYLLGGVESVGLRSRL